MRLLPLLLALLLPAPALAQEAAIEDIRADWAQCQAVLADTPDDWLGWRRNFDGGYADHFEFHDNGETGARPSVLVETWLIDAIATQTDTSCFRRDGSLAFLFSTMASPNLANHAGPALTREGRLYFDRDGRVLRILTRILADGREVAKLDNAQYRLARGCGLTAPHADTADVRAHLRAELGDIEGARPPFRPDPLDWCELGE